MVFLGQPLNDHDHLERCLLSFKQQGVAGVIYLASDTRTAPCRNRFATARCRWWWSPSRCWMKNAIW
jgi:DNA-binding LacI/PurR family transcriptional regulator